MMETRIVPWRRGEGGARKTYTYQVDTCELALRAPRPDAVAKAYMR